jgi:hypothetical protein
MKARALVTGIMLAGFIAGCDSDGSGHVELSGKPPAQASADVATAVCSTIARCGSVSLTCMGGGPAGGTAPPTVECTASVRREEFPACYADVQPDIEHTFTCPDLTPALVDMIELCLDAMLQQPCPTQAQLDAVAAQAEVNGGSTSSLDPPECAFLKDPNTPCFGAGSGTPPPPPPTPPSTGS